MPVKGEYQMTARSQIVDDPLLLLHFILSTIKPDGNPARFISDLMSLYLPGDSFMYREIIFDMTTDRAMAQHAAKMGNLVQDVVK
jgi:hypothetical protein